MLEMTVGAFKWLAERFLQLKKDTRDEKRKEWMQVADFFDQLAVTIDTALAQYNSGIKPYRKYSQLLEMKKHFSEIIKPVIDDQEEMRQYESAFEAALPIVAYDCTHLAASFDAFIVGFSNDYHEDPLIFLEKVAGQFHGLSISLRAKA